uniref:ADP-ribosylation factor 6-like n=1 Tax=Styela clava TaxID=7725 RepID=UPI00193A79A1|nr:ADP-ribosylation factor 6-like [Styela clava]
MQREKRNLVAWVESCKMGSLLTRTFKPRYVRVLILGLDAAGKTTLLTRIKHGRTTDTIPTIGFNVESVKIKGIKYTFWDVGGQDKLRELWKHYYFGTHILAFVIDSSSRDTIEVSKEALFGVLMDPLMDSCVLLVYANKQDMPYAFRAKEIADKLSLHELRERPWHVQPSCATTGDGVFEGLQWAAKQVKKQKKKTIPRKLYFTNRL